MQHIITKTAFMYGCQCPKRLFLEKTKPEVRNHSEDEEDEASIVLNKYDLEKFARQKFPGGTLIDRDEDSSLTSAAARTQEAISSGQNIIYEACFMINNLFCAIDILIKKEGKWSAVEVKGSKRVKPEHILDASFQYFVITQSGISLRDFSILHLNGDYIREGDLNFEMLFMAESVLPGVMEQQYFVTEKVNELKAILKDSEPDIPTGSQCTKPYPCDFTSYCGLDEGNETAIHGGSPKIAADELQGFLRKWEYPLFYFDFETIMPAIPEFSGSRPFQQIPFQFSLHIQSDKETDSKHVEFLGNGKTDPREDLINHMLVNLGEKGSIITWNMTFEKMVLKELARDFPKYKTELMNIHDRIVDLMVPFRKKWFDHPDFGGSYSLKKVLPVLVPDLKYDNLEIQEGTTASSVYYYLIDQNTKIQEEQRKQLLEYCKLDTLAMVRLFAILEKHLN